MRERCDNSTAGPHHTAATAVRVRVHVHELAPQSLYHVMQDAAHSAYYEQFDDYCDVAGRFLSSLGDG